MAIDAQAFKDCTNLLSVEMDDSVESIGESTFSGCSALQRIHFSDNVKLQTLPENTCLSCSSLVDVHLPESLRTISWAAFQGCTSLATIELPEYVKSFGNRAFRNCSSLESIVFNGDTPTSVGTNVFQNIPSTCKALVDGTLPRWSTHADGSRWSGLIVTYK